MITMRLPQVQTVCIGTVAVLVVATISMVLLSFFQAAEEVPRQHFSRFWPIVYLEDDPQAKRIAEKVAHATGGTAIAMPHNPLCCLWIDNWSPSGTTGKFLLTLQSHGGFLYVSDDEGLDQALKWIEALPKDEAGFPMLPLGVKTNFQVN